MKIFPIAIALLGGLILSRGQENAVPEWDVEIPTPIADGARSPIAPKPKPIHFKVLASNTRRQKVTEAAEMPELPPVKGTINVTVQMVEDPGLPDPPPLPTTIPSDPAVIAKMEELRGKYRGTELIFVSATVYDHSHTLLQIFSNGKVEGEISAWTNIDFNHFSGFSTYRIKASDGTFNDRGLLMGISNIDTDMMRQKFKRQRQDNDEPEIPILPDLAVSGPSFTVIEGETQGEAMDTLCQIHDLYRKEGARMAAAFDAREKANAERKAYLLANPPIPEDIVIRFWKCKDAKAN